jgi:hypothetical protein
VATSSCRAAEPASGSVAVDPPLANGTFEPFYYFQISPSIDGWCFLIFVTNAAFQWMDYAMRTSNVDYFHSLMDSMR